MSSYVKVGINTNFVLKVAKTNWPSLVDYKCLTGSPKLENLQFALLPTLLYNLITPSVDPVTILLAAVD